MSIESAKAYMLRMREDPEFRRKVNACGNPEENWAFIRAEGFDFSVADFKKAQHELMDEHGHDQLPKND